MSDTTFNPANDLTPTPAVCSCGERLASECDEKWGPNCDLGNNEKYVKACPPVEEGAIETPLPDIRHYTAHTFDITLPAPFFRKVGIGVDLELDPDHPGKYTDRCAVTIVTVFDGEDEPYIIGPDELEYLTGEPIGEEQVLPYGTRIYQLTELISAEDWTYLSDAAIDKIEEIYIVFAFINEGTPEFVYIGTFMRFRNVTPKMLYGARIVACQKLQVHLKSL